MSSKGYKETEIGLIPEGWKLKAFSDIVDIIGGGTPKTTMEEYWEGEIPWLSVVDFNNEFRTVNETEKSITEMGLNNSSTKILKKGELIISARGTVGAIAQLGRDMAFNQSCYGLRAMKTMTDNDFIYYLLKYSLNILKQTTHGSTFDTITKNTFDLLKVPLPPMKEQIKIASILSVLDDKIELNHRMNQTLEAIGQAIFRHWFVHFEFPNSEGQPYRSSGGEMVDSELGEIPKGWDVQEIGNTIETTGGGTPSTKKEEYWENGDIQWFSPRDITANKQMFITDSEKKITKKGLKNSSAKLFPPYSLMMTSRATVGELSINTQEASTNQGFITCIPNEKLSTYYLHFWIKMNKENIISLSSGSTFREINKSTFRALKIVIPNNEVLSTYNSLLKSIFSQIEILQAQNQELSQIRASLLPKLMSGKIRVNIPEEATVK